MELSESSNRVTPTTPEPSSCGQFCSPSPRFERIPPDVGGQNDAFDLGIWMVTDALGRSSLDPQVTGLFRAHAASSGTPTGIVLGLTSPGPRLIRPTSDNTILEMIEALTRPIMSHKEMTVMSTPACDRATQIKPRDRPVRTGRRRRVHAELPEARSRGHVRASRRGPRRPPPRRDGNAASWRR